MKRLVGPVIGLAVLFGIGFTQAIGSTTPTGQIVVRSVNASGKLTTAYDRLIICPVDPRHPDAVDSRLTTSSVGRCAALKNGVAILKNVKRGSWIAQSYLAVGAGPCYNKVSRKGLRGRCTRIVVSTRKKTKIRWNIPFFG